MKKTMAYFNLTEFEVIRNDFAKTVFNLQSDYGEPLEDNESTSE
jgi:hypothetical protein